MMKPELGNIGSKLDDRLTGRTVEVWTVDLQASDRELAVLEQVLEPEEITRADRFLFTHLRRSWIAGRGALRLLLGNYLGISGRDVRLTQGPRGKPSLALEGPPLHFNLSHCGSVAVFGFTRGCEIGVDVEEVREMD